jgi:hypothetical protein
MTDERRTAEERAYALDRLAASNQIARLRNC